MNLAAFAVTPPDTISAHTRALIASGAYLIPAHILRLATDPGSQIICPACFLASRLEPVWNTEHFAIIGFICACGHAFDSGQALHLVFGHLNA